MFYLIVVFVILAYRVFKAAQTDFTYGPRDSEINLDKLMPYIIFTIFGALAWPIVLPCYGIYQIGKRYKKVK